MKTKREGLGWRAKIKKDNKVKEEESDTPKKMFKEIKGAIEWKELLNEMKERKRCTSRETKKKYKPRAKWNGGKNEFDKQNR